MKNKDYTALIGKIAITDTALKPSGTVLIDNEIYPAESVTGYVEAGRGVLVIRVKGKKIHVQLV